MRHIWHFSAHVISNVRCLSRNEYLFNPIAHPAHDLSAGQPTVIILTLSNRRPKRYKLLEDTSTAVVCCGQIDNLHF